MKTSSLLWLDGLTTTKRCCLVRSVFVNSIIIIVCLQRHTQYDNNNTKRLDCAAVGAHLYHFAIQSSVITWRRLRLAAGHKYESVHVSGWVGECLAGGWIVAIKVSVWNRGLSYQSQSYNVYKRSSRRFNFIIIIILRVYLPRKEWWWLLIRIEWIVIYFYKKSNLASRDIKVGYVKLFFKYRNSKEPKLINLGSGSGEFLL